MMFIDRFYLLSSIWTIFTCVWLISSNFCQCFHGSLLTERFFFFSNPISPHSHPFSSLPCITRLVLLSSFSSSSPSVSFSGPAVTGKPFFVVSSLSHRWLFGWEGCRFYGWAGFFFGCGSLITMTVVSLDRYLKICHLRYGIS